MIVEWVSGAPAVLERPWWMPYPSTLVAGGVLFVLLLGFYLLDSWPLSRITPPLGVGAFDEYVGTMETPRGMYFVRKDSEEVLMADGEIYPWVLPSGPPVCVFDREGPMVDWTSDSGSKSPRSIETPPVVHSGFAASLGADSRRTTMCFRHRRSSSS
ncbi:MAG: hypothetical protein HYY17_02880 [Planctomycetes bacterium]|nr:hypothetical protein [Planctomycetota bacterium]